MNEIGRPENLMKMSMKKVVMRCSHTTDKDSSAVSIKLYYLGSIQLITQPVSISVVFQGVSKASHSLESCQHIDDITNCRTLHSYTSPRHR